MVKEKFQHEFLFFSRLFDPALSKNSSCCPFHLISERISVNDNKMLFFSSADSAWMNLMDIRIIKGNCVTFYALKDNAEIAITEEAAKMVQNGRPDRKEVKMLRHTKKICAIVRAENRHTTFDFIGNPELGKTWWYITWNILIKVNRIQTLKN